MTAAVKAQLAAYARNAPPAPRKPQNHINVPAAPVKPVGATKRANPRHLEDDLQAACVAFFRYQYPSLAGLLFAIPNGGQRSAREGSRLKAQGVTAGVPDIQLAYVKYAADGKLIYPGLFLELKVGANKPAPKQLAKIAELRAAGYRVAVVYSLAEFMAEIRSYLHK